MKKAVISILLVGCICMFSGCGESVEEADVLTSTPADSETAEPAAEQSEVSIKPGKEIHLSKREIDNPPEDSVMFDTEGTRVKDGQMDYARLDAETGFERTFSDTARVKVLEYNDSGVEYPAGMLLQEDSFLICDKTKGEIVRLSYEGERLDTYGSLGNQAGQFYFPTQIREWDGNLYILDSGNCRIQVFDKDMAYICSIGYEYGGATDMEFDAKGNLYLALDPKMGIDSCVYYIDRKINAILPVKGAFACSLGRDEDQVYAVSRFEIYGEKSKNQYGTYYSYAGYGSGDTYMFTLTDGEISSQQDLIYDYNVTDFAWYEGDFYFAGFKYATPYGYVIDRAKAPDYEYIESYELNDNQDEEGYIDIGADGRIVTSSRSADSEYGKITIVTR